MDESALSRSSGKSTNSALALKNKITPSLTNRVLVKDSNFFSVSQTSARNTFDSKDSKDDSVSAHSDITNPVRGMSEAKTHILSIDKKLDSYLKEIG